MSLLNLHSAGVYIHFDEEECRTAGRALADAYRSAKPYPHIVIDDFLPKALLREVAAHYPNIDGKTFFDRDQERFKFQFSPQEVDYGLTRNLLTELNSRAFAFFLEEMTGIPGLIPDPHYLGGGLHLTRRGGHLGVHADFNQHEIMQVERRLNLLVYLNDQWEPEYGGALELWDAEMKRCEKSVAPVLGRAVVFSTDRLSYHGHPDPLACPPDRDRRSIATYYYTSTCEEKMNISRTTDFRARPNTNDRIDWAVKARQIVKNWVPPRLQAPVLRVMRSW